MNLAPAYEDAVDLLDADHKGVKALFIQYNALCEDDAPAPAKQQLAEKICADLTVHAKIEEEIFYPKVREATGDEELLDHAEEEHAQAKALIAKIQGMKAEDAGYDETVRQLGEAIDAHVREEREQIFLKARLAALDLRGMVVELAARKKALTKAPKKAPSPKPMAKEAA
jgi:hemerythrin superfamily protein